MSTQYGSLATTAEQSTPSPRLLRRGTYHSNLPKWSVGDARRHSRHDVAPRSYRLLDRNAPFNQSSGSWRIERRNRDKWLYASDWFHTLLNSSLLTVVLLFCGCYIFCILLFAFVYLWISGPCGLEIYSFKSAVTFSTETIMTIGYGLPSSMENPYFERCSSLMVVIMCETLVGVLCDAVCLGLVFGRLSRGQTRATTIIFSDYAILRRIGNRLHFMFQTAEMRKHQLVEAHVRCYVISRYEMDGVVKFRTDAMRLSKPDDEIGSTLLMNLPSVIVHDVDQWSPLYYLAEVDAHQRSQSSANHDPSSSYMFPDVLQRDIDVRNGNRETRNAYKTFQHLLNKDDLMDAWRLKMVEVVALIEGIDATTSCTIQARHSYTVDDMLWDCDFAPCVTSTSIGSACIDFAKFHHVTPLDRTSASEPPEEIFSCT